MNGPFMALLLCHNLIAGAGQQWINEEFRGIQIVEPKKTRVGKKGETQKRFFPLGDFQHIQ
jgi:hypothetical protein